jgi:hypothetical protein
MKTWHWIIIIAALIIASVIERAHYKRTVAMDIGRVEEARKLEFARVVVSSQEDVSRLQERLDDALSDYQDLSNEFDKYKSDSKLTFVIKGSTGPTQACGQPRVVTHVINTFGCVGPNDLTTSPGAPCLLETGDEGEVRALISGIETQGGNNILMGELQAWRLKPEPATKILGGTLKVPFTVMARRANVTESKPRWGMGPRVGFGLQGFEAGVIASPAPWKFLGVDFELIGGAKVWQDSSKSLQMGIDAAVLVRP